MARNAVAIAALATLLESCIPIAGKLPAPPMLSEVDARATIVKAFASQNIALTPDQQLAIPLGSDDVAIVTADGYNDQLRIGFEYITSEDRHEFTEQVRQSIDKSNLEGPQHILTINAQPGCLNTQDNSTEVHLRQVVNDFLASLRAQGVI
ncbi:MAG: hypothetical protein IPH75_11825 [bacterium]|nr:hypothetical protein [bacterium]